LTCSYAVVLSVSVMMLVLNDACNFDLALLIMQRMYYVVLPGQML